MADNNCSININNLHKQYPGAEFKALNGLNVSFPKGIIAGLLGPNGAGKTTTISIICGILAYDKGNVEVLGMNIQNNSKEIKRKIGIVPQQIALYPNLSIEENLTYIGSMYGISNTALKSKIRTLLPAFGLEDSADRHIIRCSGGIKRRANIIAALLHEPEILILDEPTAGVDVQSRSMILDFLKIYNQGGNTVIYTSHYLEEAEKICDEVAIIDMGNLIAQDTPKQLIAQLPACQTLEEVFIHYTGRKVRE